MAIFDFGIFQDAGQQHCDDGEGPEGSDIYIERLLHSPANPLRLSLHITSP
jgi:hypothetical protein